MVWQFWGRAAKCQRRPERYRLGRFFFATASVPASVSSGRPAYSELIAQGELHDAGLKCQAENREEAGGAAKLFYCCGLKRSSMTSLVSTAADANFHL